MTPGNHPAQHPSRTPRRGFRIPDNDLTELRRDPESKAAFERIYDYCLHWVRHYRSRLSEDDYLDVVSESIFEELDALRCPDLTAAEVSRKLQTTLERNRTRARRALAKMQDIQKFESAIKTFNGAEERIEAEHLQEMVKLLRGYIGIVIELLPDRDYQLLYEEYKLERFGLQPRTSYSDPAPNPNARKVALHRARRRFLHNLEEFLVEAEKALAKDRLLVQDALALIRSSRLRKALLGFRRNSD